MTKRYAASNGIRTVIIYAENISEARDKALKADVDPFRVTEWEYE